MCKYIDLFRSGIHRCILSKVFDELFLTDYLCKLRKMKGPKIDSLGTPATTGSHEYVLLFENTLRNLFSRKFFIKLRVIILTSTDFIL